MAVSLNAFAQIFLRKSMMRFSDAKFTLDTVEIWLPQLVANIYLWFGMMCYGISIIVWLYVLAKTEGHHRRAMTSLAINTGVDVGQLKNILI